jgi:hypothetical protein
MRQVLLATLISGAVALYIWKSLRSRVLLFALTWYAAPMIPSSHLTVIGTLVAERLLYVPLAGWSIFLGYVLQHVSGRVLWRKWVALAVIVGVCTALAGRTVVRNRDWKNNNVLFTRTLEDAPNSLKARWHR